MKKTVSRITRPTSVNKQRAALGVALLFTLVEPEWAPFFADPNADVDWRVVSWGGVLIDDRPRDIAATIYHHLGIPPHTTFTIGNGRPMRLNEGQLIQELL